MKTSDMRRALRDAGVPVKRSNEEVEQDYAKLIASPNMKHTDNTAVDTMQPERQAITAEKNNEPIRLASNNIYTYVGAGEEPPHMINFMGMQKFIRGQPVEVTNPTVLKKIRGNRCFVKGKVGMDTLFESDEKEKIKADAIRERDKKIQMSIDRVNKGKR